MICPNHGTSNTQLIHDMLSENTAFFGRRRHFFYRPAAAMKHHRVACLCEVSPYSEQYSQSLPLYKSETLREKSLLHVFPFVFSKPSPSKSYILSNPHLNFSDYWNPEPWNAWSPMKCRCLQTKSSRLYVHVCWLLPAFFTFTFAFSQTMLLQHLHSVVAFTWDSSA